MAIATPKAVSKVTFQQEEVASITISALSLLLSLIGFSILMSLATLSKQMLPIVACSIYGTTLVALFASSTLYHSAKVMNIPHVKGFRVVDHCAIYLAIPGAFAPFALITLKDHWGMPLFYTLWVMALFGCVYKIFFYKSKSIWSTLSYIIMGWSIAIVLKDLITLLPSPAINLIVSGGITYTLGAVFYTFDKKLPYGHAIWHVFVLGGSLAHYLAVVLYVIPAIV